MSKKSAPWINLTPDRPGLDAQSRDTINEWCGVVGKQEKHRRHYKRNIQFPSRAVNWKNQQLLQNDSTKKANGLEEIENRGKSNAKTTSAQRSGPNDNARRQATSKKSAAKAASSSRTLAQKKGEIIESRTRRLQSHTTNKPKESLETKTENGSDEQDLNSEQATDLVKNNASTGVRVDPFDSVPGTIDDSRQAEIIDYYMQILDPSVTATFFVFDMRSTYGSMPLECLVDEEFRPLGLASIAGTMSSVKHAAVNREYIFAQLGKGMRQLRRRLGRPGEAKGDIILISIMFLAATAYVTGDLKGFDVHRKSLKQLVAMRGGLDQLGFGGGTKTVLLQWDSAWTLSTGRSLWIDERPRNEPVYPRIPPSKATRVLVKRLPTGFQELCNRGIICIELLQALSRMTTAMSYNSPRNLPYDQKIGSYDDYLSISSLQPPIRDRGRSSSRLLEALLSLALILFSSRAFNDMRATPVLFRGPRDALYELLLSSESDPIEFGDDAHNQCYHWIWAVTVDAWRDASQELMPQGYKLLFHFHSRHGLQFATSEDLVTMLKRFFWTDDLIDFHKQSFDSFKATDSHESSAEPT